MLLGHPYSRYYPNSGHIRQSGVRVGVELSLKSECWTKVTQPLLETGDMFPLCSWVLLSKQSHVSVGGPRHAGGLPSGRAKREQAEMQLVLRKGIEKGGGVWPRNSRIRKLIRNFNWSWRRKNIPLFPLDLNLRSLLHLHLMLKSHGNLELSWKKEQESTLCNKLWPFILVYGECP